MFSLSTCWNAHRHKHGRAMLEEIRDLGFEYAELGHSTPNFLLKDTHDDVRQAVEAGVIRISSLHNFCPLPVDVGPRRAAPNIFQFSAEDPHARERAFHHTLVTMDWAAQLGAKLVVLHMGSAPMKDFYSPLADLLKKGQRDSAKYQKIFDEMFMARNEPKMERYWINAKEILRRLVPEAESRGLKLGIESRDGIDELPFESDLRGFFREFTSPAVCYWHDTGHAQIKENLGVIHHLMQLETYADRLAGFHVHDVEPPLRDHRPPGKGMIDFKALKAYVRPDHLKVFEFSPSVTTEEVREGVAHLKSIWGDL